MAALSSDLNSLLLDLQSGGTTPPATTASSSADPTTTVANDLQSVFGDLSKAGGSHGHHHHHADADAQNASHGSATAGTTGLQQSGTNPFQNLAASLLSYTKGQGLTASQSTSSSLTALFLCFTRLLARDRARARFHPGRNRSKLLPPGKTQARRTSCLPSPGRRSVLQRAPSDGEDGSDLASAIRAIEQRSLAAAPMTPAGMKM